MGEELQKRKKKEILKKLIKKKKKKYASRMHSQYFQNGFILLYFTRFAKVGAVN